MHAKSGVDLSRSSPLGPFTGLGPEGPTLSHDSLLFGHSLDHLFGLLGDTDVNVEISKKNMSCAAQAFRLIHLKFARAIGQPPGQVAYLFQLPFRNSFLRRWVGTLVQWLAVSSEGQSNSQRLARFRRMVSCHKIDTFVGCRSRNSLQRLMTYVRLHTGTIAAYYDIIPRIPGSWRAGFLSTTALTALFAWPATVENRHSVVKPAAG